MKSNQNTNNKELHIFHNIKDSLFTFLFRDIKYLRQLYSVIADDNDKYEDSDFQILTLENVFVPSIYNDLGFIVGNQLIVLVEEQTTFNPNMPMRYLHYIASTYQNYISNNKINIYGTRKIIFPEPRFYLIYTGKREFTDKKLYLSNNYYHGNDIHLELVIDILTSEQMQNSILEEYIQFCQLYDKNVKEFENKVVALKTTINYCIAHNILRDFLQTREREVEDMLMQLYTQEQILDMALEEKYKEGLEEGKQALREREIAIAKNMKTDGIPTELICQYTGLSKEVIERL